jgi:UDP-N-acetylglucosamine 2-epimerase (non-hydrolysing)
MSRKKILIVFGTRPDAIKMAPLLKAFQKDAECFETKVCVTAQHRAMLDQVLAFFEITPDYDLDIMRPGQDLYDITTNVLLGLRTVLSSFNPDLVFVHGDTSTNFSAALAAFYQRIPVAHIEAGLRTGNIYSPWPEEANRKLTTQITTYHFAPTPSSKNNLLKENVDEKSICVTGNTVIDALFMALHKIQDNAALEKEVIATIDRTIHSSKFKIQTSKFILVTGHRRENYGEGFINICTALKMIAQNNQNIHIVYALHLNPNVQKPVKALLSDIENIHLIEPVRYEVFVYLMRSSFFIITDSGGVQEEAPSLGKPVLLMRDRTERPEALEEGTVKLVGAEVELIVKEAQELIDNKAAFAYMSKAGNPYGDGYACQKIVEFVKENS